MEKVEPGEGERSAVSPQISCIPPSTTLLTVYLPPSSTTNEGARKPEEKALKSRDLALDLVIVAYSSDRSELES